MREILLTTAQNFMYRLVTEVGPKGPFLHLIIAVHIKGPISVDRLQQVAEQQLPGMHPVISAAIGVVDQKPVQYYGAKKVSFEAVTVTGGRQEVDSVLSDRADRPFDIFSDGPLRIVVALTGKDEAYLLFVGHHIFFDVIGLRIVFDDYLDLCLSDSRNLISPPRENPERSFFSYASQEAEMAHDGTYERRVEYWVQRLRQADPELHVPGKPADLVQSSQKSIPFSLDADIVQRYSKRASLLGVTLFSVASSAFFEALRRYTGQSELLLGVAADARRRPFERTAGMFSGMFLLRQSEEERGLSGAAVRKNFQNVMQASKNYIHHRYFMSRVDWLKQRASRGVAISDAYIDFFPPKVPSQLGAGRNQDIVTEPFTLRSRSIDFDQPLNNWAIGLIAGPERQGLSGRLEYESSIFSESAAQEILRSWVQALEAAL